MSEFKTLVYPGNGLFSKITGRVAYIILDREIFFTADKNGPSTINFAEQIIELICEQERISWKDYTFYDIETILGYPARDRKESDFCIDQLMFDAESTVPRVLNWKTVACSPSWYGKSPGTYYSALDSVIQQESIEALEAFVRQKLASD